MKRICMTLEDPSLGDIEPEPQAPVTYELVQQGTVHRKVKLISSDGYTYNVKRSYQTTTHWQCTIRPKRAPCRATVRQVGELFFLGQTSHNHPPNVGATRAVKIAAKVKQRALADKFKPAATIVDEVLLEDFDPAAPCPALQKPEYLARNANYTRQQLRPKDPVGMDFELQDEHLPPNFMRADVQVSGKRHLIMATDQQLQKLKLAKSWYIDGTFKLVRQPFTQLLSINAFVKKDDDQKQVPLLFVLMSGKSIEDYREVFQSVINLLDADPAVRRITIDYEAALWAVIRRVFPGITLIGCAFHWSQAVWRKIAELGLAGPYRTDDALHKYLRKVLALPFLPAAKIRRVFNRLHVQATSEPLQRLFQYIESTWIHGSVWTPIDWSVYQQSVRTNNDIEGWHNRLNHRANGKSKLNFYALIEQLHQEALLTRIQIRLVSEKKLCRRQRRTYRQLQAKIFRLWDEYESGERSKYQLLDACSHLNYGPVE